MPYVDYDAANYPGLRIDDPPGSPTFVLTCREALGLIAGQPLGQQMLDEICQNAPAFASWGGCVVIKRPNSAGTIGRPGEEGGSKCAPVSELNAKNGQGSASAVYWNPNIWYVPGRGSRPAFIGLAHELVHAWHNAHGTKRGNYDEEEMFTVGLGQYMVPDPVVGNNITENAIRLEHNVPIRHEY